MAASDKIRAKLGTVKKREQRLAHQDTRRKPGLLHSLRAVEVEAVNPRMRKECRICGKPPKVRRMVVRTGSGRTSKSEIYCIKDGREFLTLFAREVSRAEDFLTHGYVGTPLRLDSEMSVANVGVRLPNGTRSEDLDADPA